MARTFKTFGQIIGAAFPARFKSLIPFIAKVIEWCEDPESPGSGRYRIAYFEQPRPDIQKESPTEQSGVICSVVSNEWLPGPDSNPACSGSG